jgi:hypothetical protein
VEEEVVERERREKLKKLMGERERAGFKDLPRRGGVFGAFDWCRLWWDQARAEQNKRKVGERNSIDASLILLIKEQSHYIGQFRGRR